MRILSNKEADQIINLLDTLKQEGKVNPKSRLAFYRYRVILGPTWYKWKIQLHVQWEFKRNHILYILESTFIRPFCSHENCRSEYDYKNDKGYRICIRCWKKTEDPTIKTSSSGLFSLGSDGAKWEE